MGSLWATGDVETQERRNRESIGVRLALPIFDVDDFNAVAVANTVASVVLAPSTAPIFGSTVLCAMHCLTLTNSSASPHFVTAFVQQAGVATQVANQIFADIIQPWESVSLRVPIFMGGGGWVISGGADAAGVITAWVSVLNYHQGNPAGMRLVLHGGYTVSPTPTVVYTVPADVREAIMLAAIFCNTNSGTEDHIFMQAAGATMFHDKVQPLETIVVEDQPPLTVGMTVSLTSVLPGWTGARLTVLELL